MGLLREVVQGRPDGVRSRLRRWWDRANAQVDAERPTRHHRPEAREEPTPPAPEPVSERGWYDVGPESMIDDAALVEIVAAGVPLVITRWEGSVRATAGECPHAGGPLADGERTGDQLVCPWHGWSFHLMNGHCLQDPSVKLRIYDAEVREGRIWVDLGAAVPAA